MLEMISKQREPDAFGAGYFGAPRGNHIHEGVDYVPHVCCVRGGKVSKIGYPYGDDLSYRYVQVTDDDGIHWRYFYVNPSVSIGDEVTKGYVLGSMQDLGKRYPGITPHVHLELKTDSGEYLNPSQYI